MYCEISIDVSLVGYTNNSSKVPDEAAIKRQDKTKQNKHILYYN
jgi:hypothetical protein